MGDRGKGRAGGREGKVQGFRGGGTKGEQPPSAGVPGNSTERLMRSLSVPAKSRPENAILPLLRRLFTLSPTDLCIIRYSLPAAPASVSGQAVKKSAGYWLHKGRKR